MSSVELSKPAVTTPWLSDLQNRSKEWGQRRADAVLGRLDDERARLQRERAQQEREIANVEQQISLLQKSRRVGGAEESDNGNGAGAATSDKKCSPTFRPCSSVCESHFLWLFSGIINGVLKLIFCIVYGALIVDAAPHLLQNKLLARLLH